MTRDELLNDIEAFAAKNGISPATVTSRGVGNSRLYRRMKSGGGCTIVVAERLRAFMSAGEAANETMSTPQSGEAA